MAIARRKHIRLVRAEYVGRRICFVTVCAEKREAIFQDEERARVAIEEPGKVAARADILVHAFCLMPDHVHLLLEGKTARSDIVKFVAQWKQNTGYIFRNELPRRFWQRRFYDHVLRRPDDSEAVAWYISMNPVRKNGGRTRAACVLGIVYRGLATWGCTGGNMGTAVEKN